MFKRWGALGALFCCLAVLPGCVVTAATVAGALTIAGQAVTTGAKVASAVKAAKAEISAKEGLGDKLAEFRRQFCASAELRDEARSELVDMMVAAGVPEADAAVRAAGAKRLGLRICGEGAGAPPDR